MLLHIFSSEGKKKNKSLEAGGTIACSTWLNWKTKYSVGIWCEDRLWKRRDLQHLPVLLGPGCRSLNAPSAARQEGISTDPFHVSFYKVLVPLNSAAHKINCCLFWKIHKSHIDTHGKGREICLKSNNTTKSLTRFQSIIMKIMKHPEWCKPLTPIAQKRRLHVKCKWWKVELFPLHSLIPPTPPLNKGFLHLPTVWYRPQALKMWMAFFCFLIRSSLLFWVYFLSCRGCVTGHPLLLMGHAFLPQWCWNSLLYEIISHPEPARGLWLTLKGQGWLSKTVCPCIAI